MYELLSLLGQLRKQSRKSLTVAYGSDGKPKLRKAVPDTQFHFFFFMSASHLDQYWNEESQVNSTIQTSTLALDLLSWN